MTTTVFLNDIPTDTARAAYAGISFTPEKRAEQVREGYAAELAQDYSELAKLTVGKPGMEATLQAEFERYREGYRVRYLAKLRSDSRCMSTMITGGSNFPVRRMEKRNNVAHKRLEELLNFRERALTAIRRTLCPELRPIMAGDSNAQDRLQAKIAEAEKLQADMKAINAAHKLFIKPDSGYDLDAQPFSDGVKAKIRAYVPRYSWEPHPFAPYELTNNNANIRRMKERLVSIGRDKAIPASDFQGSAASVEDCPADNRVRLTFPGKPSVEVRTRLKSGGFRWTPSLGVWQAYRHQHTIELAKQIAA